MSAPTCASTSNLRAGLVEEGSGAAPAGLGGAAIARPARHAAQLLSMNQWGEHSSSGSIAAWEQGREWKVSVIAGERRHAVAAAAWPCVRRPGRALQTTALVPASVERIARRSRAPQHSGPHPASGVLQFMHVRHCHRTCFCDFVYTETTERRQPLLGARATAGGWKRRAAARSQTPMRRPYSSESNSGACTRASAAEWAGRDRPTAACGLCPIWVYCKHTRHSGIQSISPRYASGSPADRPVTGFLTRRPSASATL